MLCGPAVGAALLVTLGEEVAIFANVLIYLPLTIWLARVPTRATCVRSQGPSACA